MHPPRSPGRCALCRIRWRFAALLSLGLAATSPGLAADGVYTSTGSGIYSNTANWQGGIVADGAGSTATITVDVTANRTFNLTTVSRTLGLLNVGDTDASHTYLFTATAASGTTLTFDNNDTAAQINMASGHGAVTIGSSALPVVLNDSVAITQNSSSLLTLAASVIGGPGTDTKVIEHGGVGSGGLMVTAVVADGPTGKVGIRQNNANATLSLSNANTYTGGTVVDGGRLMLLNNNRLADTGAVTVNGGIFDLGGFSDTVGTVSVSGGVLSNGTLTGTSYAVTGGVIAARLAGAGAALTKTGAGTVVLAGSNTYTGGTFLNGGVLSVSDRAGFASRTLEFDGGTIEITSPFSSAMTSANTTTLDAGGGTIRVAAGVVQSWGSAAIGGEGFLAKEGLGELVLAANNSYAGGTRLLGGKLAIDASARISGTNGGLLFNGGTLLCTSNVGVTKATQVEPGGGVFETADGATVTWNGLVSGTGELTKTGSGTLILGNSANSFSGGFSIEGGTLAAAGDSRLGAADALVRFDGGNLRVTAAFNAVRPAWVDVGGGTLEVPPGVAAVWSGTMHGSGKLTKAGAGSLTLGASNSFSGGIELAEGVVLIGQDRALGQAGAPVSFAGGTLRTLASITAARPTTIASSGAVFEVDAGTTNNWTAPVAGGGLLTKTGGGVLVLAGSNSFTGTVDVAEGSLHLAGSLAGDVVVHDGAALSIAAGGSGAVAGTVSFQPGSVLDLLGPLPAPGSVLFPEGSFAGTPVLSDAIAGYELQNVAGDLVLAGFVPQWQVANPLFVAAEAPDGAFRVTQSATGASAVFRPRFEIMVGASNPALTVDPVTGAVQGGSTTTQVSFSAAAWGAVPDADFAQAPGQRFLLEPTGVSVAGQSVSWTFAEQPDFSFSAVMNLSDGLEPRLSWTITPKSQRYFSAGFVGAPSSASPDEHYAAGIWSGRRFMDRRYLVDESRCALPLGMIRRGGIISGVFVEAMELPYRVPRVINALFALGGRSPEGLVQPSIYAPLYGGAGSLRNTPITFNTRLLVRSGELFSAFQHVATGHFSFRDYRKNLPGGSLNTALDNLCAFIMNRSGTNYVYWDANTKANEYVADKPGYVRFQSAVYPLALALVRDDAELFEQRAVPSLEYFASRNRALFKISGPDPEFPMGGPMSEGYHGEWITLSGLSGRRSPALEILGAEAMGTPLEDRVNHLQTYDRATALSLSKSWLRSLVTYHRVTGETKYLQDAISLADQYIAYRLAQAPSDFRDTQSSFWTEIGPIWETFFELYDLTGLPRYRDAAVRALQEHVTRYNFGPRVPGDGETITVSSQAYPAWQLVEVGLISEAASTTAGRDANNFIYGHRGIFMPYAAASMARATRYSGDPFFASLAKANIIGRFLNYPGYTVRDSYKPALAAADYPLRFYPSYNNTAHMNHPVPMACMIVDYLVADAERRSGGDIWFPSYFSDTGAYFRTRVYGREPGRFFGDSNVYLWLPEGLLQFTGAGSEQINYIAARGNGRLYVALSNQSADSVSATLQLSPQCVGWTPGAAVRVWVDGVAQAAQTLGAGSLAVTIPGHGSVALAIDGATPILELPDKDESTLGALTPASYSSATASFGRVVGMVYSLVPAHLQAYVYTDATPPGVTSATLHYKIDSGGWQTSVKSTYPFEFSLALPAGVQTFRYYIEAGGAASGETALDASLGAAPVHPEVSGTDGAGQNAVQILWSGEAGTSYLVERLRDEPPGFGLVSSVPATAGGLLDQGLLPDTTYTYRIRSVGPQGESSWTSDFQVRTDNELEAWRRGFFGTRANSGSSADTADPERDGLPNLVEYAFGWNPVAATAHTWLNAQRAFRLPPLPGRTGVLGVVEASPNLTNWSAAARSTNGSAFVPTAGYNLVPEAGTGGSLLDPSGPTPKLFYRLRAEPWPAD
jgi:autotransporter-associated beta strand protein